MVENDLKKGKEVEYCEAMYDMMADKDFKTELISFLKIRSPLLFLRHDDEKNVKKFFKNFGQVMGYDVYIWNCFDGLIRLNASSNEEVQGECKKAREILDEIIVTNSKYHGNLGALEEGKQGIIYILNDFFRFIGPKPDIERRLKTLNQSACNTAVTTIMTGPEYTSTEILDKIMPVIDFPYPGYEELKYILWDIVDQHKDKIMGIVKETKNKERIIIDSISGLTTEESLRALAKSIVNYSLKIKSMNKKDVKNTPIWDVQSILHEKKESIKQTGILDYIDRDITVKDVGGLKNLITWISDRGDCFSKEAEDYGLEKPKGLLTIGYPGTGKSLVCKAISDIWNMPLLRLDFGKLFNSLVGKSESRTRSALKIAEKNAPCVLWIDEIEKGLSGVNSSNDSGTASRVLSTFLTWMQEKDKAVFVVATANEHECIPSEFIRAGRFDEIFFVGLPNVNEREDIFRAILCRKGYKDSLKEFNLQLLANSSDKYSGAEIEKAINNAMLVAFKDKRRKMITQDIEKQFNNFPPLSEIRKEDFDELEEWAISKQCKRANSKEVKKFNKVSNTNSSNLDI